MVKYRSKSKLAQMSVTWYVMYLFTVCSCSDTSKHLEGTGTEWYPQPAPKFSTTHFHCSPFTLSFNPHNNVRITGPSPCFSWKTRFWEGESFTAKSGSNLPFIACICSSHTHHPLPLQTQLLESNLNIKLTKPSPTQNTDMMLALMRR